MNLTAYIYDNVNNKNYDISEVISDIRITTYLDDNPGKLEFTVLAPSPLAFWEGATVSIILDGYNMFKGFVFKKRRDEDVRKIKVTCYDQMRYLKNKTSKEFKNVTSSNIFSQLCSEFLLKYKVVDASSHICAPRQEDATSIHDMIKHALDDTLANTNEWYFIRDNFGVLEHLNIKSCLRPEVLGDKSFVIGLDYETSIDRDVYNSILLYRDDEKVDKRTRQVGEASDSFKRWGILRLYKKVDENYNETQMRQLAQQLLKYHNNTRRSLRLKCIGIKEFFAGCTFKCRIEDLGDLSMNSYLLVTQCTHRISNEVHTMELETEVVRNV